MKAKLVFFSIPCSNLERATKFYETVFSWKINVLNCDGSSERMGMIDCDGVPGCLFFHDDYKPSINGSQLSFHVDDIDSTLEKAIQTGATVLMPKGKIDCDDKGYCALFKDCEGNAVGLYSDK